VRAGVDDVRTTFGEARELWDSSQDPFLHTIRNVGDKIFGETDTGFAIGELKKLDPSFDVLTFMEEMEHVLAPVLVAAWRRGDFQLLNYVSEGAARATFTAELRRRRAAHEHWDPRVLDMRHFEFSGGQVRKDGGTVLTFYCTAQHVGHVTIKEPGKQPESRGNPQALEQHYYIFALRRDFDMPELTDWRVVEFITYDIKKLTG
jgi:import inner membrane translocase subunit TIM44